jgi:protein kinase X
MEKTSKKKISLNDYDQIKTVGTGSFGRVKLVKQKKDKTYHALKMLKKAEIIKLKQVDHIYSELSIMSEISHPFIVKYIITIGKHERNDTR